MLIYIVTVITTACESRGNICQDDGIGRHDRLKIC